MDSFQRLESKLKTLVARSSEVPEHAALVILDEAKDLLKRLLVTLPRSPKEKVEIESGKYSMQGHSSVFNVEFKQEVLFLADQLDCSEFYCAELLGHVLRTQPNSRISGLAEKAVMLHHRERIASIRCLQLILETATRTDIPNLSNVEFIRALALQLILAPFSTNVEEGQINLARKLLAEIDDLIPTTEGPRGPLQSEGVNLSSPPVIQAQRTRFIRINRKAASIQERALCAHVLYLIAACGQLGPTDVTYLVKWLSSVKDYSQGIVFYVFACVLVTINPSSTDEDGALSDIYTNSSLFVNVHTALNASSWELPHLRASLLLQWSLFVLEVRGRDPNLLGDYVVVEDEVGTIAKEAIRGGAFQALREFVLRSQGPANHAALMDPFAFDGSRVIGVSEYGNDGEVQDEVLDPDFRMYFVECIDRLVIALITRMSRVLRDIRKHEEDVWLSWARTGRSAVNSSNPYGASASPDPPRRDTEALFRLIAAIYDHMPADSATRFWTERDGLRLTPFLKWAAESRQANTIGAMYDMLASLSRGSTSAIFAYNFLSTGGNDSAATPQTYSSSNSCSWSTLFMAIHHYENQLSHGRIPPSGMTAIFPGHSIGVHSSFHQSDSPKVSFPPEEIVLLGSFLNLLRNVARYSATARIALHENHDYRVVQSLFTLASHPIPLELKAILFNTLSAFSSLDAGAIGIDVVNHMWNVLEKMEIIPVRQGVQGPMLVSRVGRAAGGAVIELEQVESVGKTYPATTALIQLLDSLIHVPTKNVILKEDFGTVFQTIPDQLGSGYRIPGLRPYIDFVAEKVFLKTFERDFADPNERWQMFSACLGVFEKALAGFDLSILYDEGLSSWTNLTPAHKAKALTTLATLVIHPGFSVMKWILTVGKMQENLLYLVAQDFEGTHLQLRRNNEVASSTIRTLRVLWRVIHIQSMFIEGLVPILNDVGDLPNVGSVGFPVSTIHSLELTMLQHPSIPSNIAMFVALPESEIPFFALKILRTLSNSQYCRPFSAGTYQTLDPLAAALRNSQRLDLIIQGFRHWLEVDAEDTSIDADEFDPGLSKIEPDPAYSLSALIRSTVLRLLIVNTKSTRPSPNIAHVLLGLDNSSNSGQVTDDQISAIDESGILHSILTLLGQGLSKDDAVIRLAHSHPSFADQCFHLINQLCVHPYTSSSVVRHLRLREHFFQRQLLATPIRTSPRFSGNLGIAHYVDGLRVSTTSDAMSTSLRMTAHILDATAMELHMLTDTRQKSRAAQLVEILLNTASVAEEDHFLEGELGLDQSSSRILGLLESISVTWEDALVDDQSPIPLYENCDFSRCLRVDEVGCQVYDLAPLLAIVSKVRGQLHGAGSLQPLSLDQVRAETRTVLRRVAIENHRRRVDHARCHAYMAWSSLLNVTLLKAFDHLPSDRAEKLLYDIFQSLSVALNSPITPDSTMVALSSSLVLVLTKLRAFIRRRLHSLQGESQLFALPIDRLHTFFKSVLLSLLHRGTSEVVRGNLYAVIIQYLQFALDFSNLHEQRYHVESLCSRQFGPDVRSSHSLLVSDFLNGCLSIVINMVDRLLQCACRDATDGSEVWKAMAFALLEVLVRLSQRAQSQQIEAALAKDGHISNFLQSLLNGSTELQHSLIPNASSLNALYVYEAKMSLLIRVAQTTFGAAKLVEARLYNCLSQCDFVHAMAVHGGEMEAHNTFLPSTADRHRQILEPMLRLAVSCLTSLPPTPSLIKQATSYFVSHREVILALLSSFREPWTLGDFSQRHLVVTLAALLNSQTSLSGLWDINALKPIHVTIVSLARDCLNLAKWDPAIAVPSAGERTGLTQSAVGFGEEGTLFSQRIRNATLRLHRWLSLYVIYAQDTLGPIFREGFSLTLIDVLSALSFLTQQLDRSQRQMQDIDLKLQSIDRMAPSEALEILQQCGQMSSDALDVFQLRQSAWAELHHAWQTCGQSFLEYLASVEILLWVMWRNITSTPSDVREGPNAVLSARDTLRPSDARAGGTLAKALAAALTILNNIPYSYLLGAEIGEARKLYMQLLSRRLQDMLGRDGDLEIL
ncbi:nucleoporin Nup186/Nup192/Nup205 [Cantharellus anzutake]|uniref:nucleoporin Nup186/Nup192/Nup205 n=1 Tax=Cantharellus anzutake TaxID=1750568 RepID=UPI0019041F5A|nr:nucleoporin Nup186/Nup192/Nup205 [Cantharellus anzutake]KAF8331849.1 nucleoporin Nup186/Nup192/Nup205 [Cantharellus anzutake]